MFELNGFIQDIESGFGNCEIQRKHILYILYERKVPNSSQISRLVKLPLAFTKNLQFQSNAFSSLFQVSAVTVAGLFSPKGYELNVSYCVYEKSLPQL